jgi:hypothetical protein
VVPRERIAAGDRPAKKIYDKRAASPYAICVMRYQFQLMAIMA